VNAARLVLPALRWDPERKFDQEAIDQGLALGVGGFIVFGLNAIQGGRGVSARHLRALIIDVTARAGRPLLWASDLERGAGQQIAGCTELPPPAALASLRDPQVVRWAGWHTGREAHAVGINWVLAPVCDIDLEPKNPIVQTRAFGEQVDEVSEAVAGWVAGARSAGVLTCAKHWPGHGRTTLDSHDTIPVVDAAAQLLRDEDEAPFRAAIGAGADAVMTAHVAYPGLDASGAPATFSRPILGRLREIGFEGLIATDALLMDGAAGDPGAVALAALEAGCDILCYPRDVAGTVRALEDAGADPLVAARIETSVRRYEAALGSLAGRTPLEAGIDLSPDRVADRLLSIGLRRGDPMRGFEAVALEIVDDDQGGRWPASPNTYLRDSLAAGERAVPAWSEAPERSLKVLMALAEPRASKGRAGFSPENRARLANLAPKADLVVLFGHPRLMKEIPGDRPLLLAWHRQRLMQDAVARYLEALR
jgi:beta-glucosidase-like glycosyl hydrolase